MSNQVIPIPNIASIQAQNPRLAEALLALAHAISTLSAQVQTLAAKV